MKILIIDERKGQEITPEIEELIDGADIHLTIHMDSMVEVHVAECVINDDGWMEAGESVQSIYVEAPHRDALSGAKSAAQYDKIEQARIQAEIDNPPEDPLKKVARAWEGASNSGTEKLKGF